MLEDYCHFHPREKTKYSCEFCNRPICEGCTIKSTLTSQFVNKDAYVPPISQVSWSPAAAIFSKGGLMADTRLDSYQLCPECYYNTKIYIIESKPRKIFPIILVILLFPTIFALIALIPGIFLLKEPIPIGLLSIIIAYLVIAGIPTFLILIFKILWKYVFIPRKIDSYKKAKEDFLRSVNKI